jgi:uncharacterized protein YndB with AHSA1/START domain
VKSIRKHAFYPFPPELVWRALTDSDVLASWLMPNDIKPVVGHRFQFRTKPAPGFDGIVHCEVLEAEAPRRLVYSWGGGPTKDRPTRVEWTLQRVEGGTRLVLEHSGFHGVGGYFLRSMLGRGWGHKLTEPRHFLAVLQRLDRAS